jgi:hypothetical protein
MKPLQSASYFGAKNGKNLSVADARNGGMMNLPPWVKTFREKGFQVHETLDGLHEFVAREGPPGEFPFSFELDWGPESLMDFLNPVARDAFFIARSRGVIRVGELAQEADCRGTLEFRCFSEAKIRYRLYFSVENARYEYIGEKIGLRPWNLHKTLSTCYGVLYELETGKEVSRSRSSFRISRVPSFLYSFTLNHAGKQTR